MRHGDARIGGHRQRRSHPGHHFKRYAVFLQQLQLLAAAPKQKRVASLEAYNALTLQRLFQQNSVDFLLRYEMVTGLLAHVDALSLCRDKR